MPGTARGRDPVVEEQFLGSLYKGGELLAAGKVVEAREHLEKANELQPKNEKAQNLLGLTYFKLGLFDQAASVYELLVRENPADPTLRVNIGLVYLKSNNLYRAVKEFETATDLEPGHKKAHNYLGLTLAQMGDYAKAQQHFEAAGSDQMAEKMAKALQSRSSNSQVVTSSASSVLGGSPSAVLGAPSSPSSPSVASLDPVPTRPITQKFLQPAVLAVAASEPLPPPTHEDPIEVMSDDEPPPDEAPAEVVVDASLHGDWGSHVPGPVQAEATFTEDLGAQLPHGDAPLVAPEEARLGGEEELPVLDAVVATDEGGMWVTEHVAEVPYERADLPLEAPVEVPAEPTSERWGETPAPEEQPWAAPAQDLAAPEPVVAEQWGDAIAPAAEEPPAVIAYLDDPVGTEQSFEGVAEAASAVASEPAFLTQDAHQFVSSPEPAFTEQPMAAAFAEQPVADGFAEQPVADGFAEQPVAEGFAEQPVSAATEEEWSAQPASFEPMPQEQLAEQDAAPQAEGAWDAASGDQPAYEGSWDAAVPAEGTDGFGAGVEHAAEAPIQAMASEAALPMPAADEYGSYEAPPADDGYEVPPAQAYEPVAQEPAAPGDGYAPMVSQRLGDLGGQDAWVQQPSAGPFQLGPSGLAVTVAGEMLVRMTGLVAVVGSVQVTPEFRRKRGRATSEPFGTGESQLQRVRGNGVLYLEGAASRFHALDLTDQPGVTVDDEGAYLREELVFAFEEPLSFENGRLSEGGMAIDLVHLKGHGRSLLALPGTLKAMPVPPGAPMVVPLGRLVGWFGRVTPRLMGFGGQGAVELTGEGFALLGTPT